MNRRANVWAIVYFARLHGLSKADAGARARRWLAMLDIEEYAGRPCSELSKGNQQKVQLACAAVHEPELLILGHERGVVALAAVRDRHEIRAMKVTGIETTRSRVSASWYARKPL